MPFFVLLRTHLSGLKSLITIFLFLCILIQTFSWIVYNAAYVLNKNYIAGNLCINKDKPATHCDGKCYLAKQMQQQEKQDQQSNDSKKEKFEMQFFFLPEEPMLTSCRAVIDINYHEPHNAMPPGHYHSVFHPPCA
jgi:hypothetical protein